MRMVMEKQDIVEIYDAWTNTKYQLVRGDFGLRLRKNG
jgi:hypothetical protein